MCKDEVTFVEEVTSFVFMSEKGGLCKFFRSEQVWPDLFRLIYTKGE
jgi:hypothetical protein